MRQRDHVIFDIVYTHVNVVASLIFSGMSGSAIADAAGIGKIIIGMMTKSGHYTQGYAAAITASSATIGPIIPPSIPMVLYALVSNTSIGYLFPGGIVPGLLIGVVLMAMNYYISHRRGFLTEDAVPIRELPVLTVNAFPALLMPAILLYGIYGGVTTPTEAAAVATFYALILAVVFYRALSLRNLYRILVESARSSEAVGLVIGGALILNFIVASENIPGMMANALVGLDFLAEQIRAPADALDLPSMSADRMIRRHRREVRVFLGIRRFDATGRSAFRTWVRKSLDPSAASSITNHDQI